MSDTTDAGTLTLRVSRTLPAPRARVFAAWTEPKLLSRWWGPRGYTTPSAEIDLRPGGAFRLAMQSPEGDVKLLTGEYREVRPPARLVYTWRFDAGETTLVTVEFNDRGSATEIVLTHERFATEQARTQHQRGWGGCLDRLTDLFAGADQS
jgi:uncharacterized protein YndB with AHSA1/START domain